MSDTRADAIQAEAAREAARLWPLWFDAARCEEVAAAISALHDELDAAVARQGATCWQSGDCCRFDDYGHRLYVTGLEAAWFLRRHAHRQAAQDDARATDSRSEPAAADTLLSLPVTDPTNRPASPTEHGACPYQIDNRCTVHAIRPMGCRVFFCEPGTEQWQRETYERFHTRMRELHATHGIAYRYMEWRAALEEGLGVGV
ncbi:MAG: hypothetical protein ACOC1G_02900 [Phycisphaeraceae bacterium]